jgi:plastocyanin
VTLGALVVTLLLPTGWPADGSQLETPGAGERVEVDIGDNYYDPEVIRVKRGDVLVFTNRGRQLHALTLIGREAELDQAYLDPGKRFAFPVSLPPGEYVLGCNIHLQMRGKIVVETR